MTCASRVRRSVGYHALVNQLSARWERERRHLWGLCYRMTGDAAEAEDLVQETFSRALLHAPDTDDGHVKAWLTKVATNLAIDQLRRRRHQAYSGPWLPAPVYNDALLGLECAPATGPDLEERYGLLESASFAVLQALEHLEA